MIIRSLYYISKVYGLTPFLINKTKRRVEKSLLSSIACLLICVTFNGVVVYVIVDIIVKNWTHNRSKLVILIVHSMAMLVIAFKNLLMHLIYIYRRNDLIEILNEAFDIQFKVNKACPDIVFISREYLKKKTLTIIFKVIQIIGITLLFFYEIGSVPVIHSVIFLYIITFPMIMTSFYFCGTVLASARFYEILKVKLENVNFHKVGFSVKFSVSNEIDCVIVLHNRISNFVRRTNKFFGLQIMIFFVATFIFCVSVVSQSFSFSV